MVLKSCKRMLWRGLQLGLAFSLVSGILPMSASAEQAVAPAAEQAAAPAPAATAAPAGPVEAGNPAVGKALFTGEKRFTNGGPPCISCHSAGVGELGGGVVGPNLTKIYADESKNMFVSGAWINGGGSPVMGPVFGNKNVTDEEVGDLRAFLEQQSKTEVAPSHTGTFTVIGLGGFVGILIVFNIIWSGRYRNRNNGTAHDALWRNYGGKGGR
jgi:quinol---cytochrome-c reductase cytochrome c subunit